MIKKLLLLLLLALIIIQFIHPARNISNGISTGHISKSFSVPASIDAILAKACYDCHSNNTRYPWYSKIQPVDWWMNNHVIDGKKELNFDEYGHRSLRYRYHKLEEIEEQVRDGEMPLESYTWIHKDARLTADEKTELISWTTRLRDTMRAQYPEDSLIRKK